MTSKYIKAKKLGVLDSQHSLLSIFQFFVTFFHSSEYIELYFHVYVCMHVYTHACIYIIAQVCIGMHVCMCVSCICKFLLGTVGM